MKANRKPQLRVDSASEHESAGYGQAANDRVWSFPLNPIPRVLSNSIIQFPISNHGFLYDSTNRGWRLSPAYDVNPLPRDVKSPYLSTLISEKDNEASFELVLSTGEYYGLAPADLKRVVEETVKAVSGWREVARRLGMSQSQIERMASAFEHEAYADALAYAKCPNP